MVSRSASACDSVACITDLCRVHHVSVVARSIGGRSGASRPNRMLGQPRGAGDYFLGGGVAGAGATVGLGAGGWAAGTGLSPLPLVPPLPAAAARPVATSILQLPSNSTPLST